MLEHGSWWIGFVVAALSGACLAYARHLRYVARVQRAAETIRLAADWERQGQIQRAYRAYCAVCEGSFPIKRADLPTDARDRVLALHRTIIAAHDATLRALEAYRDRVGRYPDSLVAVQADIPEESKAAFRGFEYERKGDSDLTIVTGLYASRAASHRRRGASTRTARPIPAPTQPIH
jgi:hypothetical protein